MPRTDYGLDGIIIYETNSDGLISLCDNSNGSLPTTANKFSKGCILKDTTTGKSYENQGTVAVPSWNEIGGVAPSEISLASAHILVGNSSGKAADVAMSSDATIDNTGVVTVSNGAITVEKIGTGMTTGNNVFYVDGNRTDTYTETGSILAPYKKISTCIDAINALVTAQLAIGVPEYAANCRYVIEVSNKTGGTYSDNISIGNVKYLRINLNGAEISGAITYTTTMVGGTADQYYSKLEFFGGNGVRAEKGNSGRITGAITATRNNDSLSYISLNGINTTGDIGFATNGTWVLHFNNCKIAGRMTTADSALVLIETTGWNEITGHLANAADAVAAISLYNVTNTELDLINIDNANGSRITNSKFGSNVTITGGTISIDANSYASMIAQTETLSGATVSLIDGIIPDTTCAAQEEVTTTGAISIAKFLTTIDTSGGATAYTLAAGSKIGQLKKILFRVDNGDATVTGSFTGSNNTLTFSDAGEYALLQWNGTDWIALELTSVLNMAHAPVLSEV